MSPLQHTQYSDPVTLTSDLDCELAASARQTVDAVWAAHVGPRPLDPPELEQPEAWAWAVALYDLTDAELAHHRAVFEAAARKRWAELRAGVTISERATVAP
jgi:hypothetical protein